MPKLHGMFVNDVQEDCLKWNFRKCVNNSKQLGEKQGRKKYILLQLLVIKEGQLLYTSQFQITLEINNNFMILFNNNYLPACYL